MLEPEDSLAVPDSTTREQRLGFSHGEDVLLQHKDGKYYLGTIVEVDLARERCLVKFLDNTSSWSSVKELTKLTMPDCDVMCVLCKKSQPKADNDIIVCDKCGRGYHQLCHLVRNNFIFIKWRRKLVNSFILEIIYIIILFGQPQIPKEDGVADAHWMCKRCVEPKNSMVKANIRKVCSGRDQPQPPPEDTTKLPYDVSIFNS